nr:hypothetical protein 3 [bacterium]
MKNGAWKFWFAIIGALLTASGMFWNLKVEFVKTQVEVEHIKHDVAYIKRLIEKDPHAHYQALQTP